MEKYYICNDIRFITGMGTGTYSPCGGTHFKKTKALDFIANHPNYICYKARTTPKGNDYVISTKMKFVGNDGIVDNIQCARYFPSVDTAYEYLDNNRDQIDDDICFVIDSNFCRKMRKAPPAKREIEPEEIFSDLLSTSNRITLPTYIREKVYEKSGGVCQLCGKPLSKYAFTVDHIQPLSRGGTNELDNLRAVHEECNKLKGKFTDSEMYNTITPIICNSVYNNLDMNTFAAFMRSFVRGVIKASGMEASL